jgi:hypothetical protein
LFGERPRSIRTGIVERLVVRDRGDQPEVRGKGTRVLDGTERARDALPVVRLHERFDLGDARVFVRDRRPRGRGGALARLDFLGGDLRDRHAFDLLGLGGWGLGGLRARIGTTH